jgi:hypothetical protein
MPETPAAAATVSLVLPEKDRDLTRLEELDEATVTELVRDVRRLDRGYGFVGGAGFALAAAAGIANLAGALPGGDVVFFGLGGVALALSLASAARGERELRQLGAELGLDKRDARKLARALRLAEAVPVRKREDAERVIVEKVRALIGERSATRRSSAAGSARGTSGSSPRRADT